MIRSLYYVPIILFIIFLCSASVNALKNEQILQKANKYLPLLHERILMFWNDAPNKEYFGGQIEQETCNNIQNCWSPYAELKTSLEYGVGLCQITVTKKFNKFTEACSKYSELKGWKWENRYNAEYQITFLILEDKYIFNKVRNLFIDNKNRWAGTLVGYNAGLGTVLQRRALCRKTPNCNYVYWFGGLDTVSMLYEKKNIYGRELGSMRNSYPSNIIKIRSDKYKCLNL